MIIASIVLAGHAPRFFDVALDRTAEDKAQLGLDAAQPAPGTLFDQKALTSLALPSSQRLR